MVTIISTHRPFLGKLTTSICKRRYGFKRWLAGIRGRGNAAMTCRYYGAEFLILPDDLIGREIAKNRYEWRELAMMLDACRQHRPDIFIDVGANIGLYSCIVGHAGIVPKVVAFEPDRRNFSALVDNIARNDLSDVIDARPSAVGGAAATATLIAGGSENSGLSQITTSPGGDYPVEVVTLDDAFDLKGRAIALKIDVEGHELDVLRGAAGLLRANRGYAQIEAHTDARFAEVNAIMQGHGWQLVDRYGLDARFERAIVVGPSSRPGSAHATSP